MALRGARSCRRLMWRPRRLGTTRLGDACEAIHAWIAAEVDSSCPSAASAVDAHLSTGAAARTPPVGQTGGLGAEPHSSREALGPRDRIGR